MALSQTARLTLVLSAALLLSPLHARADQLDSASQEALEKTQNLLTNEAARKDAVNQNADTKAANAQMEKLGGSQENTNAMYGLSSDIFAKLVKDSNGDSAAMQKALEEASKNPGAFLDSLTPEQKQSLEAIAQKIESNQASGGSKSP